MEKKNYDRPVTEITMTEIEKLLQPSPYDPEEETPGGGEGIDMGGEADEADANFRGFFDLF